MEPKFICHPDFCDVIPVNLFHKEEEKITLPEHPEALKNRHTVFRHGFDYNGGNAVLKITADDYYKLYINGKYITQGPASGYPFAYFYNELDVTPFLKKGNNTIAVHTYYQGLINRVWISGDLRAFFWCELCVEGKTALVSDCSWKCKTNEAFLECGKIGYDTQYGECYDSSSPDVHCLDADFDDSSWENAGIFKNCDSKLIKQETKQLSVYDVYPVKTEKTDFGVRLDFGQEMVGYFSAKAKGNKGDTLVLHYSEELTPEGRVRNKLRCNCLYEDKWILSGGEDELMQYDYKAYRYVEVFFPENVNVYDLKMTVRHYPFEKKAVYKTENPDLKKILELCENTIKFGTQEGYVDCPTREKGEYLGDVSISARSQCVLSGDPSVMKKALSEFCRSTFICPGMMAVSSSALMQEIADYSLQFPAQVTWLYAYDGDIDFLKFAEPYATGIFEYFKQYMNGDALLDGVKGKWNLVDWPANLRDGYDFPLKKPVDDGIHNVMNAFWIGFLSAMDEMYSILGKPETGLTEKAKKSFISAFYSEETGLYCDSAEKTHSAVHSNLLPLLFGIGTEDESRKRRLIEFIKEKKLSSMGVYMAYFTLAALVKNGETALAEELATDKDCWMLMLSEGATTTFEAWGKDQKWNTSLFHPWATAPLIVFADGVRPY